MKTLFAVSAACVVLGCSTPDLANQGSTAPEITISPETTATPAPVAPSATASAGDAVWKHPGMNMTFRYPAQLLTVQEKPDGAYLKTEILAEVEDLSDRVDKRPTPFSITISVWTGDLLDVMKRSGVSVGMLFPSGKEESFKEDVGEARITVSGKRGYSLVSANHGESSQRVFAQLAPGWTLALECRFVGDMFKPKVPLSTQAAACDRVISTLAIML